MARQSEPTPSPEHGVPVLLTRPRDQGEAFARQLILRFGHRVRPCAAPLMQPEFLSPPVPEGPFTAVIFTSAHGVEGAIQLQVPLPRMAYCVGRSTATAATAAGFEARSADGDAMDLIDLIETDRPKGRLVYIRGVDTSADIANILISKSFPTESLQVYLQRSIPFEGESLALLLNPGRIILPLFSPRSARLFQHAIPPGTQANLQIIGMSAVVTQAAADVPHSVIITAARPDAAAMLDAVETLLAAPPLP